jgi:hypothetical protein
MRADNPDQQIWIDSYLEEAGGLKEQNPYSALTRKKYTDKYSHIQIIPSMSVQTIKRDKIGDLLRAKTRVVALGNHEERVWSKSDKCAPVLQGESSRLMTSMDDKRSKATATMRFVNPFYLRNKPSSSAPQKGAH